MHFVATESNKEFLTSRTQRNKIVHILIKAALGARLLIDHAASPSPTNRVLINFPYSEKLFRESQATLFSRAT